MSDTKKDRATKIHQCTFIALESEAERLKNFSENLGRTLYDCKFTMLERVEGNSDLVFWKCNVKFYNCGSNLAQRKLAEFIIGGLRN